MSDWCDEEYIDSLKEEISNLRAERDQLQTSVDQWRIADGWHHFFSGADEVIDAARVSAQSLERVQ
jgi:hypothetical protein